MADGIPVKVVDSELTDDGLYVTVEIPGELREDVMAGALDGFSIPGAPSADNARYDESAGRRGGRPTLIVADEVDGSPSVPSRPVETTRADIERHRHIPPPSRIGLGDVIAKAFGAEIAEDREGGQFVYRPNRAQRRAAARRRRGK